MEEIQKYKFIIGLVILSIGFYWFQIRPTNISRSCLEQYPNAFTQVAGIESSGRLPNIDTHEHPDTAKYKRCLVERGF